jgi:hypothetical protein
MDFGRVDKDWVVLQLRDKSDRQEREICPTKEFAKIAAPNQLGCLTTAKNFNT